MCGFVGCVGQRDLDVDEALLSLLHRGPDSSGIYRGDNCVVGFNRLAIQDLSPNGMQPFVHDGVVVFVNGEIYNSQELKRDYFPITEFSSSSDCEIVPHLYRRFGLDFLNLINGMFAMVIIDERKDQIFLVRDRYGKKPLFTHSSNGRLFFASEIKALKCLAPLEPDPISIAINLTCWILPQPFTLYRNVESIAPGSVMVIQSGSQKQARWYKPDLHRVTRVSSAVIDDIEQVLSDAVRMRLRADVPVGVFLSGGLDSMLINSLAVGFSPSVLAYNARIPDKAKWEGVDTDAAIVTRFLDNSSQANHRVTVDVSFWTANATSLATNFDQVITDSGLLVMYALAEEAANHGTKVVLAGIGGDELFGNYPWQSAAFRMNSHALNMAMRMPGNYAPRLAAGLATTQTRAVWGRLANHAFPYLYLRLWHSMSLSSILRDAVPDLTPFVVERLTEASAENFSFALKSVSGDPRNSLNFANIFTTLSQQNAYLDMASMFASIENRSPLLDYRLVEYLMSIPFDVKVNGGPKSILRAVAMRHLPYYVTEARKSGPSMPLDRWFADGNLVARCHSLLSRSLPLLGGYVSGSLVDFIETRVIPDKKPDKVASMRLFAVVNLALWLSSVVGQPDEL